MRLLKTKWFARFARREKIADANLREAVERAEAGLIDAELGSGLIKQRLARAGAGRSGGYRTIVLYRSGLRAIFVYGFAKNKLDDLRPDELEAFKVLADELLAYDDAKLDRAVEAGELIKVEHDG